ncbi:50S ribosomal protein L19 [Bacteroidota bacterium]|nr:50S ribosomal protein L19 [Bacteroidota bacterium]
MKKFIVTKEKNRTFAAHLGLKPMNSIVNSIASEYLRTDLPAFKAGDRITVYYKIKEGAKERIQLFQGDVLQRRNAGIDETFTVRKISNGIGVERIFPTHSPFIDKIEVNRKGRVRRARIFYLRTQIGKAARIKELRTR